MDDFTVNSLTESRNEYSMLFITKVSPIIGQGFESMFEDTCKLCRDNEEDEKYLMAFQNFLARVPKWNKTIIDNEVKRIQEESNCEYLEDLLTCVHVTQLKILTNVRVGQKQKKLELEVPQLDVFIHKVYIECARKLYKNVFLFEMDIMPIQRQKYKRDIDNLIRESITDVIRLNMPIENILKAYLDETCEQDIYEDIEESFENIGEDLPDSVLNEEITDIKPVSGVFTGGAQNTNALTPTNTTSSTPTTLDVSDKENIEDKIPIDISNLSQTSVLNSSHSIESTPLPTHVPSPISKEKKAVQFIGDFKENEPSGYNSSGSEVSHAYASDGDGDADDENDAFKLKIGGDTKDTINLLGEVTDLGTPKSNEIKLEFEELK